MSVTFGTTLEDVIERYHRGLDAFMKGDHESVKMLFSQQDDVTLGNPYGPFARGFDDVVDTMSRAAAYYRDGQALGFDRIATYGNEEFACIVEVERLRSKVGDHDDLAAFSLRVTTLFRAEEGGWKVAHRHADPIDERRPAESVLQP